MSAAFLDVCPRCQTDISRRLGLITSRKVDCPQCGRSTRVTASAIRSNWQYNFAAFSGIAIFVGVSTAIQISPDVAAQAATFWQRLGYVIPSRLLLALISPLPPLVAVLPLALVGRLLGQVLGWRLVQRTGDRQTAGAAETGDPDDLVLRMLARYHSRTSGPPQRSQGATLAIRMAVCCGWSAVFFAVAGLAIVAWVGPGAGGDVNAQRLAMRTAVEFYGPGVLFGSTVLAVLFGALGWLPGTRHRRTSP